MKEDGKSVEDERGMLKEPDGAAVWGMLARGLEADRTPPVLRPARREARVVGGLDCMTGLFKKKKDKKRRKNGCKSEKNIKKEKEREKERVNCCDYKYFLALALTRVSNTPLLINL